MKTCKTCLQTLPETATYRKNALLPAPKVKKQSVSIFKRYPKLTRLPSEFGVGVLAVALICGGGWLFFPGISYLGIAVNEHIFHFNLGSRYNPAESSLESWLLGIGVLLIPAICYVISKLGAECLKYLSPRRKW